MALIRIARREDAEALVRLINAAFAVERFFLDADRIDLAGVFEHFGKGEFLVAEEGAALVACAHMESRGERGYLGLLSVDPARQGAGLGRAMVEAAEERCRELGRRYLDLRIVNVREELPAFYRKLGYRETVTEPFPPEVETKVPCHLVNMTKAL